MKILLVLLGSSQNWTSLGVISMHFQVLTYVQDTECGYFLGLLKFQTFFGVLDIPGMFWGEKQMLGPSLRMKKK